MYKNHSLTSRVLKGGSIILFFTALSAPLGYFIKILYSRTLSIESFGLIYAVISFYSLLLGYTNLGFGYSVVYLIPKLIIKRDYKSSYLIYKYNQFIELTISIIISIFLILIKNWLSIHYFKNPDAAFILSIFTLYFVFSSITTSLEKVFIGLQEEKYYSSLQFSRLTVIMILSYLLYLLNIESINTYSITWVLASIIITAFYYILFRRKNSFIIHKIGWNKKLFQKMCKLAPPSIFNTFLYTFIVSADIFFLTLLTGVKDVGVYAVVTPLVSIPAIFLTPLFTLFLPLTSSLIQKKSDKIRNLINRSLKLIPFMGVYFAFFLIAFPDTPVKILFGDKWLIYTRIPIIGFSLGYTFVLISNFLSSIVVGMGLIQQRFKISIFTSIIYLLLIIPLTKYLSVFGVSITVGITFLFSTILQIMVVNKKLKITIPFKFYFLIIVCGLVFLTVIKLLNLQPVNLFQYLIYGFIYTTIYAILGLSTKLYDKNTVKMFFKNVK